MAKTSGGVRGSKSEAKLRNQLRIAEGKIRRNKYESAIILDSKGRIVLDKRGARYSVGFTQDDIDKMKDMVVTHNHPRALGKTGIAAIGHSFSMQDIVLAVNANVKEIRAVTPTYTFSLKRPAKGWGVSPKQVEVAYREAGKEVKMEMRKYLNKVGRTQSSYDRVDASYYNQINKRLAAKFGWIYSHKRG